MIRGGSVLLAATASAASAGATWAALAYARRRRMIDHPGARRVHRRATPRGGGIAPVAVIVAGGVCQVFASRGADGALAACLGALALVAAIGWCDDHRPLSPLLRLLVHLLAAALAWLALGGVPRTLGEGGAAALGIVAIAGLTNAWNFMDGIDGLATSQAAAVLALLLVTGWAGGAWQGWGLLALFALLGFLPFNAPHARIFLGDVGSGALGFLIAVMLLHVVGTGHLAWPLALLPPSAFLIDAGLTLVTRMASGKPWWRAHREHLYQWLVRQRRAHAVVAAAYAAWTVLACAVAVFADGRPAPVRWALTLLVLSSGALAWFALRRRVWTVHRRRR